MGIVIVVLLVAVVVLVVVLPPRPNRKPSAELAGFAREQGLTLSGDYPELELSGRFQGVTVSLSNGYQETEETDSDGNSRTERRLVAQAWAEPAAELGDLRVYREGLLSKLGKALGGQDVQLGNPDFDKAFMVKASNPAGVPRLLGAGAQRALLEAIKQEKQIEIRDGVVRWEGTGVTQPARAQRLLTLLTRVAGSLGG